MASMIKKGCKKNKKKKKKKSGSRVGTPMVTQEPLWCTKAIENVVVLDQGEHQKVPH
ncbi:unnamed protein product [Camellia sinensis]